MSNDEARALIQKLFGRLKKEEGPAPGGGMTSPDAGDDRAEVLIETGWFQGRDGQWRFEIDDSQARLKKPLPSSDKAEAALGEVLEHEALFKAYPQLKSVKLLIDSRLKGVASYNPATRTLRLNPKHDWHS